MLVGLRSKTVHFGVHVTFASAGLSKVYLRSCKYGNKLNHCMSIKQAKLITSGSHPRAACNTGESNHPYMERKL